MLAVGLAAALLIHLLEAGYLWPILSTAPETWWQEVRVAVLDWFLAYWWLVAGALEVFGRLAASIHCATDRACGIPARVAWVLGILFLPLPMVLLYGASQVMRHRRSRGTLTTH